MAMLKQVWHGSFGLTKTLVFNRPFLAMAMLKQVWHGSFGLTKTLVPKVGMSVEPLRSGWRRSHAPERGSPKDNPWRVGFRTVKKKAAPKKNRLFEKISDELEI